MWILIGGDDQIIIKTYYVEIYFDLKREKQKKKIEEAKVQASK